MSIDAISPELAGENAAYLARSPLHVKMLLEARADLHAVGGPGFGLTPLNGVTWKQPVATMWRFIESFFPSSFLDRNNAETAIRARSWTLELS